MLGGFHRFLNAGLSVVWRIGCWPPARYVVAGGTLYVRSGWVSLRAGDLDLEADVNLT